jgi:hypothetical protein
MGRVARWFVFKPKIPIWVNFEGPKIGKCWNILWPFGIFYGHLGYFKTIWYIFPVWVSCAKKNLATLDMGIKKDEFGNKEKVTSSPDGGGKRNTYLNVFLRNKRFLRHSTPSDAVQHLIGVILSCARWCRIRLEGVICTTQKYFSCQ